MSNVSTVEAPDPVQNLVTSRSDGRRRDLSESEEQGAGGKGRRGRRDREQRVLTPLPAWRLARIVRYVDARLEEKIRLTDLAQEVRLSRMHFAAQFKAATGLRPLEYVVRRRIAKAQELLVDPEQKIVQVALAVGFKTQAHFTTVFRRLVGETPYRWRVAVLDRQSDGEAGSDHRQDRMEAGPNPRSLPLEANGQPHGAIQAHQPFESPSIRIWRRGERPTSAACGPARLSTSGASVQGGFPGRLVESPAPELSETEGEEPQGARRLALLEQAVAGAVHDINSMVACMIATMELVPLRLRSGRASDIEALIEEGRIAGERASRLASRMMDYTRPIRPAPRSVNVNELIHRNWPLLCRALGDAGVCRLDLRPDLPPVWCDPVEMERVLLNLITNARDALSGRTGTVTLQTRFSRPAVMWPGRPGGSCVCIAVSDNGGGMPSSVVKKAFEPFVTTKVRGQGAGLGLSLVHRFVDAMDGRVDIESGLGTGTIVRLYLPADLPPPAISSSSISAAARI